MVKMTPLKTAMLAAASFAAIGAAAAPALAGAPVEPIAIGQAPAADHTDQERGGADKAVGRWLAGGAVAAALAGLVRLFGWSRLSAALKKAGAAVLAAPGAAARYVGDAVKSPLRFAVIVGALSLFALAGFGFYDVDWAAGLVTGGALAIAGVIGARRLGKLFARR